MQSSHAPPGPLGLIAAFFVLGVLVFTIAATALHWYNLFVIPALFLVPVSVLYVLYWRRWRHAIHLDLVVRMFAAGFIPATAVALVLQLFLYALFGVLFFGGSFIFVWKRLIFPMAHDGATNIAEQAEVEHGVALVAFTVCTAFVSSAFVEEAVKLFTVRFKMCRVPLCVQPNDRSKFSPYTTLVLFVAVSMGLSTSTDVLYCLSGEGQESAVMAVGTVLLRSSITLPVQTVAAMFTAMAVAHRDHQPPPQKPSLIIVLLPATVFHGLFDLIGMLLATELQGVVSETTRTILVVTLGIVFVLCGLALWSPRWRHMLTQLKGVDEDATPDAEAASETDVLLESREDDAPLAT